jgi:hypothetical protein
LLFEGVASAEDMLLQGWGELKVGQVLHLAHIGGVDERGDT